MERYNGCQTPIREYKDNKNILRLKMAGSSRPQSLKKKSHEKNKKAKTIGSPKSHCLDMNSFSIFLIWDSRYWNRIFLFL